MCDSLKPSAIVTTVVLVILGVCRSAAGVPQRLQVDDLRSLLVAAIDSPSGEASAELTGEVISAISSRFKTASPLQVHVTTLRRYKQPGCSRLNVRLSQEGVQLPQATSPQTRMLDVGMNYCRDGNPPVSLD
jgi:hypothetical protein